MISKTSRLKAIRVLSALQVAFVFCLPAFSQANLGRISGSITDQTGGAMAGAQVTVMDTERGVTRTLTTDDAGAYNASNLTPGTYTVRAEAKGFKTIQRERILIESARNSAWTSRFSPASSSRPSRSLS